MWHRISDLIGNPIAQKKAVVCQKNFRYLDRSHAKFAACASCCEHLLSSDGQEGKVEMNIDASPLTFLLTNMQIQQLTSLPCNIVETHIQVVQHNGHFYHLNPNLVFNVNKTVLFPVCANDPMTNIRSRKQDNTDGTSNILLPCPVS
jgi:hypothetical protein